MDDAHIILWLLHVTHLQNAIGEECTHRDQKLPIGGAAVVWVSSRDFRCAALLLETTQQAAKVAQSQAPVAVGGDSA
jgi:hypothetical protein